MKRNLAEPCSTRSSQRSGLRPASGRYGKSAAYLHPPNISSPFRDYCRHYDLPLSVPEDHDCQANSNRLSAIVVISVTIVSRSRHPAGIPSAP